MRTKSQARLVFNLTIGPVAIGYSIKSFVVKHYIHSHTVVVIDRSVLKFNDFIRITINVINMVYGTLFFRYPKIYETAYIFRYFVSCRYIEKFIYYQTLIQFYVSSRWNTFVLWNKRYRISSYKLLYVTVSNFIKISLRSTD